MTDELLFCVMELGERFLTTGAEVRRVEESITIVCKAYGVARVDVYATTSHLIVSVINTDGVILNQTRRVQVNGSDITKLDALNALSRYVAENRPEPAEWKRRLSEIDKIKGYSIRALLICYALVAGAFTVFFGSRSVIEVLFSVLIGGVIGIITVTFERLGLQKPFSKLICSFVACSLAFATTLSPQIASADLIIIGNIMSLIPGVGLTNALRDLFTGDVISGILRSIEALLLGAVIAFGYVTAAFLFG